MLAIAKTDDWLATPTAALGDFPPTSTAIS